MYFMRKCLLLFLPFLCTGYAFAQQPFKKNDLYFEFLGNGIWSSISYERQLKNEWGWGARIGIGYFSGDEQFRATIPIGINYLFPLKNNKSFLEAGIGGTWSNAAGIKTYKQELAAGGRDYSEHLWSAVPVIGYRRHTKSQFMWRTSMMTFLNKYRVIPSFGIAVGKRF